MEVISIIGSTFINLLTTDTLLFLILGVLVGTVIGILPALGTTAGMALLVPFVYGMEPYHALAMMTGLLAVVSTGDTVTSILMGIPGAASSQATIVDGFPMAKKGEAGRALSAAYFSSMIGGVFGAFILTAFLLVARPVVLAFGMGEQLMLALLGLSLVSILSGNSLLKGLIACGLGMTFGMVGSAPASGEFRMQFGGSTYLTDGLPLGVVALAIFAFPEIINLLRRGSSITEQPIVKGGWAQGVRDVMDNFWLTIRCSAIGCLIGALPIGGSGWLAYGHTVQSSKDKSQFGKGDVRGVIGPEAANNADTGGSLIPTLIFGIPGGGSAAIFLGGLLLIGFTPGPRMLAENLDVTYTIIWCVAIANIFGAGICFLLSGHIAKLTAIPFSYLAPFMLTIIMFGAYNSTRDWGDLIALFSLGVIAIYLKRFGYSRPAFLIGFVLQNVVESLLYRILQVYSLESFFSRPIIWVLIGIVVFSLVIGLRSKTKVETEGMAHEASATQIMPQVAFLALIMGFLVYSVVDVQNLVFLAKVLPIATSVMALTLCTLGMVILLRRNPQSAFFHDGELGWKESDEGYEASPFHYVWWMMGFLLATYLVGFLIAIALFYFAFMRIKAKAAWWSIALMAGCTLLVLSIISYVFLVDFPTGILQDFVWMPWPFGR
ncbi:tripartite tricarboxylate transporter permease [Corticibacterium sp. UT-5YL-CI-8]|nr:tripartite tricarboxylate transporter permease [Tianweitania sp. UT-5YL-CI-8]